MPSNDRPKRILIGEISGAHGIRGDVLVRAYTGEPDAIASYGPLTDETGKRSFSLRIVRVTPKGIVARVSGVSDRNAAEPLRGTKLYVERAKLPDPDDGVEFYYADLIGLSAVDATGAVLGSIVSVQNFGAGDLLELKLDATSETEFIPFKDEWFPKVDVAAGTIFVNRPQATDETADDDGPPDETQDET